MPVTLSSRVGLAHAPMILLIHRVMCGKLRGKGRGGGDVVDSLNVLQSCQDSVARHESNL